MSVMICAILVAIKEELALPVFEKEINWEQYLEFWEICVNTRMLLSFNFGTFLAFC